MRYARLLAFLLFTLAALSCSSDPESSRSGGAGSTANPPAAGSSRPVSVTGADWVLVRLGDAAAEPTDPRARPRLRLDPGNKRAVTGNTGVNQLSGTYELSGGALQFGPMITTRRAGPPELMRQESAFLRALEQTATADARGNRLDLRDAAGNVLAQFEAADVTP